MKVMENVPDSVVTVAMVTVFPKEMRSSPSSKPTPEIVIVVPTEPLSAVAAAFAGKEEGYRIYIEQLFKALEKIGATSFLITEINMDMNVFSRSGVEEFLSDGVIAFYNIRKGNIRVSATEIIKLRGAAHK